MKLLLLVTVTNLNKGLGVQLKVCNKNKETKETFFLSAIQNKWFYCEQTNEQKDTTGVLDNR